MEEFAADGYTHVECFGPRCRMKTEADKLASSNLDGTYHRAAFSTATLCGAHYRGYMIEGEKERRGWLVHVSPERPELPILRHADFHVTDKTWTQAVSEAVAQIEALRRKWVAIRAAKAQAPTITG